MGIIHETIKHSLGTCKAQNGQNVVLATSGLGFKMIVLDINLTDGPCRFQWMSGCAVDAQTF